MPKVADFEKALQRWDSLRSEAYFSVPPRLGKTAILYCAGERNPVEETEAFSAEAFRISDEVVTAGKEAVIYHNFTYRNLADVASDFSISDVVVIANGSLSTVNIEGERLDWRDVSDMATHLKMGRFVQRQCGQASATLNVPFGTFMMADHSAVDAAFGHELPVHVTPEHEALIRPVHNHPRLTQELVHGLYMAAFKHADPVSF